MSYTSTTTTTTTTTTRAGAGGRTDGGRQVAYPDFLTNPPNITDLTVFYKNAKVLTW